MQQRRRWLGIRTTWLVILMAAGAAVHVHAVAPPTVEYSDNVPKVVFGYGTRYQEAVGDAHGSLLIKTLAPGGPAAHAGLRQGDVITAFNGVPFRFRNDVEAIRAMAWVEAGKPLELTVRRGTETWVVTMVPTAADPQRQRQLDTWLTKLEADGKGCFSCQDRIDDAWLVFEQRVEHAGGKVLLLLQHVADQAEIHVRSPQIEVPEDLELDERYLAAARRLPAGEYLRILVTIDGHRSSWLLEGAPGFEELKE